MTATAAITVESMIKSSPTVSDNGPQFNTFEIKAIIQMSCVTYHKEKAPNHPSINDQVEYSSQCVVDGLKAVSIPT